MCARARGTRGSAHTGAATLGGAPKLRYVTANWGAVEIALAFWLTPGTESTVRNSFPAWRSILTLTLRFWILKILYTLVTLGDTRGETTRTCARGSKNDTSLI